MPLVFKIIDKTIVDIAKQIRGKPVVQGGYVAPQGGGTGYSRVLSMIFFVFDCSLGGSIGLVLIGRTWHGMAQHSILMSTIPIFLCYWFRPWGLEFTRHKMDRKPLFGVFFFS